VNDWYRSVATASLPRLMTLLDTRPAPAGTGSFDRETWKYRLSRGNFSPPGFQSGCYAVARASHLDVPANPFSPESEWINHVRRGLDWSARSQHADGSFPEWFPAQRSYCATAYLLLYLAGAFRAVRGEIHRDESDRWSRMLLQAGHWLAERDNPDSANQVAAAGAGFAALGEVLDIASFRRRSEATWNRLLCRMAPAGWLPEYGGPDVGYMTASLDMAARTLDRQHVESAEEAGTAMARYIAAVLAPGPCAPLAAISSRSSNFFLPYGWERFRRMNRPPADSTRNYAVIMQGGFAPTPASADDRYFLQLFLPSFLDAALLPPAEDDRTDEPTLERPVDGFLRTPCYGFWINLHGYGQFGACSHQTPELLVDYGLAIVSRGTIHFPVGATSSSLTECPDASFAAQNRWEVCGGWGESNEPFRLFRYLLRLAHLGGVTVPLSRPWSLLSERIRRTALLPGKIRISSGWKREVRTDHNAIEVRDALEFPARLSIDRVAFLAEPFPALHPASRFGTPQHPRMRPLDRQETETTLAGTLRDRGRATLITRWELREGSWCASRRIEAEG